MVKSTSSPSLRVGVAAILAASLPAALIFVQSGLTTLGAVAWVFLIMTLVAVLVATARSLEVGERQMAEVRIPVVDRSEYARYRRRRR